MAWTYSDYESYTGTAKLFRLRSHIKEVRDELTEYQNLSVGSSGSGAKFPLHNYLQSLKKEEKELMADLGQSPDGSTAPDIIAVRPGRQELGDVL